ncbi:MAG: ShlB/FhaC/HecB family hemolysin secretion/activation protein [Oscillatoriales cyanobacterium SM2_2_1]|nr:ShlB/FhaC/HecB family hemolysin secretion/activation protein [Oscillatoriales cyanobacterium SM2_2_1]
MAWNGDHVTAGGQVMAQEREVLIPVKRIQILGSTIFTAEELSALTAPLLNRSVRLSELQALADRITDFYQQRNYITSRAAIPPNQTITDGTIIIQVLEGTLERIDVGRLGDEGGRIPSDYVRDRALLGIGTPLNFATLEAELQLLRSNPLFSDIRASLGSGSTPTQSILRLRYAEAPSLAFRPFTDNYGTPSSGIYRAGMTVQELNLTGLGDLFSANYTRAGSGDSYGLTYQLPLSPRGNTLGLNVAVGRNPITEAPFDAFNIVTESQVYELTYRQPLIRKPLEELTLGLIFAVENSASSLDGIPFNFQTQAFDDGQNQARVARFSQDYVTRDAGGVWAFRSTFNLGLNVFGATIRDTGAPDGRFFYWSGQVLRVQRLGPDRDLQAVFRLNTQLTGDRLLPLNRFSLGGPQSVRGYRQNQLSGDSGLQGSLEVQVPVVRDRDGIPLIRLLPFVEGGTIWNTTGSNPNPQTLFSIGLGATYQPFPNLTVRLDYGVPLVNANNPGTNLQDSGFYFSVNGNF